MDWLYFGLGLIAWPIVEMLALAINRKIIEHRQKRFLKLVNVRFPDRKDISFIVVDTSDKRSMQKMERELRDHYGIEMDDIEDQSMALRLPRRARTNPDEVDR